MAQGFSALHQSAGIVRLIEEYKRGKQEE